MPATSKKRETRYKVGKGYTISIIHENNLAPRKIFHRRSFDVLNACPCYIYRERISNTGVVGIYFFSLLGGFYISLRVEIASRLEAIATRVEAIANRAETIATRVEAIALWVLFMVLLCFVVFFLHHSLA